MERVCFLLKVRREKIEDYKRRHQQVWDDMREALTESGWRNYSLFLRDDGLLVGYLETTDFAASLSDMARRDVNLRWQTSMSEFFEELDGKRPDEGMSRLEEIFHLA